MRARVPVALKNSTTETRSRTSSSRAIRRSTSFSHEANWSPTVTGVAWTWCVRPTVGMSRCSLAASASASRRPTRSAWNASIPSRNWRTSAVSEMSCVVAPQWTNRAASSGSVSRHASRMATLKIFPGSTWAMSNPLNDAFLAIVSAASLGITPTSASARVRALSTCRNRSINPSCENISQVSGVPNASRKSGPSRCVCMLPAICGEVPKPDPVHQLTPADPVSLISSQYRHGGFCGHARDSGPMSLSDTSEPWAGVE